MRLGFLVTARCNASCSHCTTSCGPEKTTSLPQEFVIDLMNQAATLWRKDHVDGEPLTFSISGGEPFLDFAQLLTLVAHGHELGATVSCVTNGFWASNDVVAEEKVLALKKAGLHGIAISTSRFHQEFVRRTRVERALRISRMQGLRTTLKCAVVRGDLDQLHWAEQQVVDQREIFPVVPYLREQASLPEAEYLRVPGVPEGRCPCPTITVREDGQAYTCCMPGGFVDFLALGDTRKMRLEEVQRRFYLQGRQQVLRHLGPAHFARHVIKAGHGDRLRPAYESVCDLCAHIASDRVMSTIADQAADQFSTVLRRRASQLLQDRATTDFNQPTGGVR